MKFTWVEPVEHAREIIQGLTDAMELWAADEDGIHPDAWEAYQKAKAALMQPVDTKDESDNEEQKATFTIGYLKNSVQDWEGFCHETGLDPWVLAEGKATEHDPYPVAVSILKKYGILN